jgi:hypothetical protein
MTTENEDQKEELHKRLTKLAKSHTEIVNKKDAGKCKGFLDELNKTFDYASEILGKNNLIYSLLDTYCDLCRKAQSGNPLVHYYNPRTTRRKFPSFKFQMHSSEIVLSRGPYLDIKVRTEIFCRGLSEKLESMSEILSYKKG